MEAILRSIKIAAITGEKNQTFYDFQEIIKSYTVKIEDNITIYSINDVKAFTINKSYLIKCYKPFYSKLDYYTDHKNYDISGSYGSNSVNNKSVPEILKILFDNYLNTETNIILLP